MGRLRSSGLPLVVTIVSFWCISACGSRKASTPLFPGRINLTPSVSLSMVLGGTVNFTASAQTAGGTNLNVGISFTSSDTSILNVAANGAACAGHWDAAFTTCTPGAVGVVTVTASALGASSVPTYVFVHPTVDSVTVTGILLDGVPVQEPCLSQSQSMVLEAHAYSRGTDVTTSVGPFTWSASNPAVVSFTPLISNNNFDFATNQVTALAATPGITYIYATAGGVTSTTFQQPQYTQSISGSTATSPLLDFFSTCPIQNISLELGAAGSGQTSFATTKGTATATQNAIATVTDVMANTSLPNTNGGIILSKIPLTWSASQPGVINVGSTCTQSCSLSILSAGSGTITASCSPPTCNVGFPIVPQTLSTTALIGACNTFFQAQFPKFAGCQDLIPVPVYSSPVFIIPQNGSNPPKIIPLEPRTGSISGVVTGTPATASVLAASTGCARELPDTCSSAAYYVSTARAVPGNENPLPSPPNSFLFDPAGDRVYMGSDFGAAIINPGNFNTGTSPYSSLGSVTGRILATSNNGSLAAFSDTLHIPNQVYITNSGSATAATTALPITGATTAAFSADGLKAFIAGGASGNLLYIYSPLQSLQQFLPTTPTPTNPQLTLAEPADAIAFSPNGAFAFVAESAADGSAANVTAFATCNNQLAATISLPTFSVSTRGLPNLLMKVLPNGHIDGTDSTGTKIPDGIHLLILDSTGFDIVTATLQPPTSGLCPQVLTFSPVQRIELGQGQFHALNFFPSADGTQIYIVNSGSSTILVYNFIASAVTGGIELVGNATPLSADISADAGTIVVSGSDGMLHEVSTQNGGLDMVQLAFPNLPNYYNAFCTFTPSGGPCALNAALAKP